MANPSGLRRKAHFLGTKIKSLRKRNRLTLEDLSIRCIQVDASAAPSVSYLSMIQNGMRVPSEALLKIIADIFQKDLEKERAQIADLKNQLVKVATKCKTDEQVGHILW